MECKVTKTTPIAMDSSNWNISRMECKAYYKIAPNSKIIIGIYPEWNVKNH